MLTERAARATVLLASLGMLAACATPTSPTPAAVPDDRVRDLTRAIAALGPDVEPEEAHRAASAALARTDELADDYRLVRPPLFHNALVNLGLRERGLCCHFAEDLVAALLALDLTSLDVHWVVARHGSRLREHSSALLTASGRDVASGLVLDAWRRGGELVWARVEGDRYPWRLHPMSGDWARLHCR